MRLKRYNIFWCQISWKMCEKKIYLMHDALQWKIYITKKLNYGEWNVSHESSRVHNEIVDWMGVKKSSHETK